MRIRTAGPADVEPMFEVRTSVRENHMSREQLARLHITPETLPAMLTGDGRGWVAEVEGRVVAFSMANAADATVFAMFVKPGYEGRGLGRALMDAAERWLFSLGREQIWLITDRDPNVRANGFYQHLGWQYDGEDEGQVRYIKRASSEPTS